ncbi:hypothetical protein [Streptomyces sp. NPDC048340]|uniref:hypothetical protein n=1 Tax=Streptomyces sp. NPDC048340 TaxID=3365537 RepID=UPI00371AF7C8
MEHPGHIDVVGGRTAQRFPDQLGGVPLEQAEGRVGEPGRYAVPAQGHREFRPAGRVRPRPVRRAGPGDPGDPGDPVELCQRLVRGGRVGQPEEQGHRVVGVQITTAEQVECDLVGLLPAVEQVPQEASQQVVPLPLRRRERQGEVSAGLVAVTGGQRPLPLVVREHQGRFAGGGPHHDVDLRAHRRDVGDPRRQPAQLLQARRVNDGQVRLTQGLDGVVEGERQARGAHEGEFGDGPVAEPGDRLRGIGGQQNGRCPADVEPVRELDVGPLDEFAFRRRVRRYGQAASQPQTAQRRQGRAPVPPGAGAHDEQPDQAPGEASAPVGPGPAGQLVERIGREVLAAADPVDGAVRLHEPGERSGTRLARGTPGRIQERRARREVVGVAGQMGPPQCYGGPPATMAQPGEQGVRTGVVCARRFDVGRNHRAREVHIQAQAEQFGPGHGRQHHVALQGGKLSEGSRVGSREELGGRQGCRRLVHETGTVGHVCRSDPQMGAYRRRCERGQLGLPRRELVQRPPGREDVLGVPGSGRPRPGR